MSPRFLFLCCLPILAADNQLTEAEAKAGWKLLFDGSSFKGWRKTPHADSFVIENGTIKSIKDPKFREDLLTEREYSDFEFAFDWRISPGGNSGVKYRTQGEAVIHPALFPATLTKFEQQADYAVAHPVPRDKMPLDGKGQIYMVAFEYQVIDNSAHADALRSKKSWAGALYQLVEPSRDTARPVGEWNEGRIVVRGKRVEHWLNGVKIVEASLDDAGIRKGIAARWTDQSPVYRMLADQPRRTGALVLQNHNDEAWFRNLKVRELK